MESWQYDPESVVFGTFTYGPEHAPVLEDGQLTLTKEDGRLFRMRLRKALGRQCRFFWVGEYGEKSARPHYHAIFFGVPPGNETVLEEQWTRGGLDQEQPDRGFAMTGLVNSARAAYVCGYTVKKLNGNSDYSLDKLDGRLPEFAQCSRYPALGDPFIHRVGRWLETRNGSRYISKNGDVPRAVTIEGRDWPLGNRHVRMLRRHVGMPELATELERLVPGAMPSIELPRGDELSLRRRREDQLARKVRERFARTHHV